MKESEQPTLIDGSNDTFIFSQAIAQLKGFDCPQTGVWHEVLGKPVVVRPGDSVRGRYPFIDTQQAQSDNIVIEDTERAPWVKLAYYDRFYDFVDRCVAGRNRMCTADDLNFDYHIAYSDRFLDTVNTVRFDSVKYNAWGGFFATFGYLDSDGNRQQKKVLVGFSIPPAGGPGFFDVVFGEVITAGTLQLVSPDPVTMKTEYNAQYDPTHNNITHGGVDVLKLDVNQFTWNLTEPVYSRNGIAKEMTDQATLLPNVGGQPVFESYNPFLLRTDDVNTNEIRFLRATEIEPVITDGYEFYDTTTNVRNAYWYGASEFAIEYDEDEREVFELTFNHTPLYNPADAKTPVQNVAWFKAASNGSYYKVEQAGGTIIIDWGPDSFFTKIGWSRDTFVVNVIEGANLDYVSRSDLDQGLPTSNAKVTKGPMTLTSTFPNYDRKIDDTKEDPLYVDVTGLSVPIKGSQPILSSAKGYYLVSIKGLPFTFGDTIDSSGNLPNVCWVVPLQNNANDIITGYADSGKTWTNTSDIDVIITEGYIEILDPVTKLPIKGLGINNSCVFDVIRAQ